MLGPGSPKEILGQICPRLTMGGIGHNLPQEAPQAFAQAVIDVDSYSDFKEAAMNINEVRSNDATNGANVKNVDLKLETVVIPVSD